jgi:REP-associated tyrosine transposase
VTRQRRIETLWRYFFVTTNLARGVRPLDDREKDILLAELATQRDTGAFFLFAYVVMPTHLHLLLYPRGVLLPLILRNLKSRTGYLIASRRGRHGAVWQARYFDFIVRRVKDFWEKMEYIHMNPVEAGLVIRPEEWKWSSYGHYFKTGTVQMIPDPVGLPVDRNALLWPAP